MKTEQTIVKRGDRVQADVLQWRDAWIQKVGKKRVKLVVEGHGPVRVSKARIKSPLVVGQKIRMI